MGLIAELSRTRKLGVEHEMTVPLVGSGTGIHVQQSIAEVLTANGFRCHARGYSHAPVEDADLVAEMDGSVRGDSAYAGVRYFPVELKTRILNIDEWEAIIPKALEICRYMGGRAGNASCSTHVHVGLPEFKSDPRVVRSLWNCCQRYGRVLANCVPPSRRDNSYCKALPDIAGLLNGANSARAVRRALAGFDRYYWLNLTNIWAEEPHIEIRLGSGTLEPERARHWTRLCLQIVQHAVNRSCKAADAPLANDRRGIEALLVGIGLKVNSKVYSKVSPELRETGRWLLKRWKHFNGGQSLAKANCKFSDGSDDQPAVRELDECVAS